MICLGGAAGVALGESLIRPKLPAVVTRCSSARPGSPACSRALIPLLIICGLIEGFVSPDNSIGWPRATRHRACQPGADVRGAVRAVLQIRRRCLNCAYCSNSVRSKSAGAVNITCAPVARRARITRSRWLSACACGQRQPRIQPVLRRLVGDQHRIELTHADHEGQMSRLQQAQRGRQLTLGGRIVDVGHQHHQAALMHPLQDLRGGMNGIGVGGLGLHLRTAVRARASRRRGRGWAAATRSG